MLYVIIRNKGTEDEDVCICKAVGFQEANKMVGVPEGHSDWVVLGDDQIKTLLECKEGYLAKKL